MSHGRRRMPRTRRAPKRDWPATFLETFAATGNVKESAAAAGVGRRTVYDRRSNDATFAAAWDDAEQESHDRLEREAFRRAAEGVEKPVFQGGKLVGTVCEYSDTLLIFLLKARRPEKYRDNHRVELTGRDGGPVVTEDRSASLAEVAALLESTGAFDSGGSARGEVADA